MTETTAMSTLHNLALASDMLAEFAATLPPELRNTRTIELCARIFSVTLDDVQFVFDKVPYVR